jgi:predicted secreted protein
VRRTVAGLSVALVCLTAVGTASAATIRIGAAANGKTIRLKQGDTLIVSLKSNPSTGHHHEVGALDLKVLHIESAVYKAAVQKRKPPLLGVPGTYTVTLRARGKGTTKLELLYVSFDGTIAGLYRVTVVVA